MLKVSYKLVVKTFGMSLATWIVMSLIFVDELNQESNAADLGSETEVVVGVNGEMGVKRGRAIELQKSDNISNYRLHEVSMIYFSIVFCCCCQFLFTIYSDFLSFIINGSS